MRQLTIFDYDEVDNRYHYLETIDGTMIGDMYDKGDYHYQIMLADKVKIEKSERYKLRHNKPLIIKEWISV